MTFRRHRLRRPRTLPLNRQDLANRLGQHIVWTPRVPGYRAVPSRLCSVALINSHGDVYLRRDHDGVTFRFEPSLGSCRDLTKTKITTK